MGEIRQHIAIDPARMEADTGLCWVVRDLGIGYGGDVWRTTRSRAVLLEDGRPLEGAHSARGMIRRWGGGRYGHWADTLYFSTSDGSDPRHNGRVYALTLPQPPEMTPVLTKLVAAIAAGETPSSLALADAMTRGAAAERAHTFLILGDTFLDSNRPDIGAELLYRAWRLGLRTRDAWQAIERRLRERREREEWIDLFRTGAATAETTGDAEWLVQILSRYEAACYSLYTEVRTSGFQDEFVVEPARRVISRLALKPVPREDGPIRVGYVLSGEASTNYCSLPEIAVTLALAHDPAVVDVEVVSLRGEADVMANNPFFPAMRQALADKAIPLHFLDHELCLHESRRVAETLAGMRFDLLMTSNQAGSAFVQTLLRPAPVIGSLGLGEIHLYTSRVLDFTAHFTRKPAMDGFSPSHWVPPFIPPGRVHQKVEPVARQAMGVPDGVVMIMSSARAVKFDEPEFWATMDQVLMARPTAWLVLVGLDVDGLGRLATRHHLSQDAIQRIRCLGWRQDHVEVIAAADLFVDTFPNGGGYAAMEAMAQGVAVVAQAEDLYQRFEERTWAPLWEWHDDAFALVPAGHFSLMAERIIALVDSPAERQSLGERARHTVRRFADPRPCAAALEDLYRAYCRRI